jgi:hypothetical protein
VLWLNLVIPKFNNTDVNSRKYSLLLELFCVTQAICVTYYLRKKLFTSWSKNFTVYILYCSCTLIYAGFEKLLLNISSPEEILISFRSEWRWIIDYLFVCMSIRKGMVKYLLCLGTKPWGHVEVLKMKWRIF